MKALTARDIAPQQLPGYRKETAGFGQRSEGLAGSAVRHVVPHSHEWTTLGMDGRLEAVPYLTRLVEKGRAKVVFCETPTSTCKEKARAAGIHPDTVVKAILCEEVSRSERYLIIATGNGRLRLAGILSEHIEETTVELASQPPPGMAHGTCTPFVSADVFETVRFIAIESPEARKTKRGRPRGRIGDMEVDVAIGGTDQVAHHLSVRIRYSEMVQELQQAYGDKVRVLAGIERM